MNLFRQERGSAIVISMIGVALLGASIFATLRIGDRITQSAAQMRIEEAEKTLAQSLAMMLSDPNVCLNGLAGSGAGFHFQSDSGGKINFKGSLAARSQGQRVGYGANYGGGLALHNGVPITDADVMLERFYVKVPAGAAAPPASYKGELFVGVAPLRGKSAPIRDQKVSDFHFVLDADGELTSCRAEGLAPTPESVCHEMGCDYDAGAPAQKCSCPLPDASCGSGEYIMGLRSNLTPICRLARFNCSAGEYIEGFSAIGAPYCARIALNCMGSWGACSKPCGGGTQQYTVTQTATAGGDSCPRSNGATRACNTQACPAPPAPANPCYWRATYTAPPMAASDVGNYFVCPGGSSDTNPASGMAEPGGKYCSSSKKGTVYNCNPGMGGDPVQKGRIECMCPGAPTPPPPATGNYWCVFATTQYDTAGIVPDNTNVKNAFMSVATGAGVPASGWSAGSPGWSMHYGLYDIQLDTLVTSGATYGTLPCAADSVSKGGAAGCGGGGCLYSSIYYMCKANVAACP